MRACCPCRRVTVVPRCEPGFSGRDCGYGASEAAARSSLQELVLLHVSNVTQGAVAGSSTVVEQALRIMSSAITSFQDQPTPATTRTAQSVVSYVATAAAMSDSVRNTCWTSSRTHEAWVTVVLDCSVFLPFVRSWLPCNKVLFSWMNLHQHFAGGNISAGCRMSTASQQCRALCRLGNVRDSAAVPCWRRNQRVGAGRRGFFVCDHGWHTAARCALSVLDQLGQGDPARHDCTLTSIAL